MKEILNYLYLHLLIFICSRTASRQTQTLPQTEYIMPIPLVPDGGRDKAFSMAETSFFLCSALLHSKGHRSVLQQPWVLLDKPLLVQGPKKQVMPTVSGFVPHGMVKWQSTDMYLKQVFYRQFSTKYLVYDCLHLQLKREFSALGF